jgi:hypothetical protein
VPRFLRQPPTFLDSLNVAVVSQTALNKAVGAGESRLPCRTFSLLEDRLAFACRRNLGQMVRIMPGSHHLGPGIGVFQTSVSVDSAPHAPGGHRSSQVAGSPDTRQPGRERSKTVCVRIFPDGQIREIERLLARGMPVRVSPVCALCTLTSAPEGSVTCPSNIPIGSCAFAVAQSAGQEYR